MSLNNTAIYSAFFPKIRYEDKFYTDEDMPIYRSVLEEHVKNIEKFPVWIDLCCYYEIHEHAYVIAVTLFGLPHGECVFQDVYNKPCGFVDEITSEELMNGVSLNVQNEEERNLLLLSINERLKGNRPCYRHSHIGYWMAMFLDKDGVDTSYERYYFKNQDMLELFKLKLLLPSYEILK